MLTLDEHPLSPYAQKCKIALAEKSVPFEAKTPLGIGSGMTDPVFLAASPRGEVPAIIAWYERMQAIGHGAHTPLDAKDALAIAMAARSEAVPTSDPHDPNGRKPGDRVAVMADDYGRDPVVGELVFSNANEIALRRSAPEVGDVVVHFPRAGFWVNAA